MPAECKLILTLLLSNFKRSKLILMYKHIACSCLKKEILNLAAMI